MDVAKFLRTKQFFLINRIIFMEEALEFQKNKFTSTGLHHVEAVDRRCSPKWLLLKISKYSQENTGVRVYF